MIAKVSKAGGGFRGALDYLTNENKLPELVSGNMLGQDSRELAREFAESRAMNERVKKPVFHASLSLHPEDRLTAQQWDRVAREYAERMGYGNSQWVAFRHGDRDHDHIHIVASRIDFEGKRVRDFQERARAEEIVRDLREGHYLREVPRSRETKDRRITRGQAEQFVSTGEVSPKVAIRAAIAKAAEERPTMQTFARRLERQGVDLIPKIQASGRVAGVSFRLNEARVAGSSLGRPYSWSNLQKVHGISFDPERDLDFLKRLADRGVAKVEGAAAERQIEAIEPKRQALPHAGVSEEIERELSRVDPLKNPGAHLHGIHEIYQDPLKAGEQLRRAVEKGGREAYEALRDRPESFGSLQGIGVGGLETSTRKKARTQANAVGRAALTSDASAEVLREALPRARELEKAWLAAQYLQKGAIGRQRAAQRLTKTVSRDLRRVLEVGAKAAIGMVTPPPVKLVLAAGRVAVKALKRGLELERRERGGIER